MKYPVTSNLEVVPGARCTFLLSSPVIFLFVGLEWKVGWPAPSTYCKLPSEEEICFSAFNSAKSVLENGEEKIKWSL